jgi:hypothetical protein
MNVIVAFLLAADRYLGREQNLAERKYGYRDNSKDQEGKVPLLNR